MPKGNHEGTAGEDQSWGALQEDQLVITDGRPCGLHIPPMQSEAHVRRTADKAKEAIIEIAEQLDHANAVLTQARRLRPSVRDASYPRLQIGIQFIQIGDDKDATESLRELDDNLKGDHGVRVRDLFS